jgi:hypothetical protein
MKTPVDINDNEANQTNQIDLIARKPDHLIAHA